MKPEQPLDARIAAEIERFLRERQASLRAALQSRLRRGRAEGEVPAGETFVSPTEAMVTEVQVELMDRQSRQLAQIEAALEALRQGSYGLCQDCGEFIGLPRLKALPFARRCRDCQDRAEARARLAPAPPPAGGEGDEGDDLG